MVGDRRLHRLPPPDLERRDERLLLAAHHAAADRLLRPLLLDAAGLHRQRRQRRRVGAKQQHQLPLARGDVQRQVLRHQRRGLGVERLRRLRDAPRRVQRLLDASRPRRRQGAVLRSGDERARLGDRPALPQRRLRRRARRADASLRRRSRRRGELPHQRGGGFLPRPGRGRVLRGRLHRPQRQREARALRNLGLLRPGRPRPRGNLASRRREGRPDQHRRARDRGVHGGHRRQPRRHPRLEPARVAPRDRRVRHGLRRRHERHRPRRPHRRRGDGRYLHQQAEVGHRRRCHARRLGGAVCRHRSAHARRRDRRGRRLHGVRRHQRHLPHG